MAVLASFEQKVFFGTCRHGELPELEFLHAGNLHVFVDLAKLRRLGLLKSPIGLKLLLVGEHVVAGKLCRLVPDFFFVLPFCNCDIGTA